MEGGSDAWCTYTVFPGLPVLWTFEPCPCRTPPQPALTHPAPSRPTPCRVTDDKDRLLLATLLRRVVCPATVDVPNAPLLQGQGQGHGGLDAGEEVQVVVPEQCRSLKGWVWRREGVRMRSCPSQSPLRP